MGIILLLSAVLPFALILYLMVFKKKSAFFAMPLTWIIMSVIMFIFWKIQPALLLASFIKGALLASEIILIVFGALLLLGIFKETGRIKIINRFLVGISDDVRVQVILIAWFFISFIEGVAGFGTPGAIAAPLLVSLGFNPVSAVVLSLIGDSTAVSFGAAGTPILLGLSELNLSDNILREVATNTSFLHLIAGSFIPLVLVYFVVFVLRDKKGRHERFYEMIPFALVSGILFTLPSYIVARFVGPELPSIIASAFGFLAAFFMIKKGILIPKKKMILTNHKKMKVDKKKGALNSFSPYIILILGLLVSRILPAFKDKIYNVTAEWTNIFGQNVDYVFRPFFTPSFYFFVAAIYAILAFRANKQQIKKTIVNSAGTIKKPLIALIFALALVQLMIVSGNNDYGIKSLPIMLVGFVVQIFKEYFVLASSFVGVLGAFITGSNTLSNILFAVFQSEVASTIGKSTGAILALQVVGGAIGNMVAVHNILAAEATVKLHGREGEILRKTFLVCLIYALVAGIAAFIFL